MTYGPFHREKSPTQSDEVAVEQRRSGEVWGRTPVGKGFTPTVEAYPGELPSALRGIQFTTPVAPYDRSAPNHAKWYLGKTKGVVLRCRGGEEFACIPADVTVLQP